MCCLQLNGHLQKQPKWCFRPSPNELNFCMWPWTFFCCFVFPFQEVKHAKMHVFLYQPWWQMRTSLILLFGKTKALFGKNAPGKKLHFIIHYLWKTKRNQQTKIGDYVFLWSQRPHSKIELIWTSEKKRPKKSLRLVMQAPLQLLQTAHIIQTSPRLKSQWCLHKRTGPIWFMNW